MADETVVIDIPRWVCPAFNVAVIALMAFLVWFCRWYERWYYRRHGRR